MTVDEGIDITKVGDRGVLKRIIKEGVGIETPSPGCEVTVHYTGTLLDGTKFDSSKDRDEPFQFSLGKGKVIKAWDIGIATMKKGEVCMLTCAPEYAYGANGAGASIPPNATLQFEVDMIDWEVEDLSEKNDKSILRVILKPGSGDSNPNDGALVTVELEGKLVSNGKVFDKREVTFSLGEGSEHNICSGVEKALEKFLLGEQSKLTIQPNYAFKSEGNKEFNVPPNSAVEYIVTLKNFEKSKEIWTMSAEEKLDQAKIYKEKGTSFFKGGKLELAMKMYKNILALFEEPLEPEENSKKEIILSTHLNLSLVYLKLTPPSNYDAKEHAAKALELDNDNVKALFRKGQALLGIGEAELALKEFQRVVELEPENKAAANQVIVCRQTMQKQKQKEKKLYANMFEKFAKHDVEVEKIRAENEVDVIGEKVGEWGSGEGEWTDEQRHRKPTEFEKENPNILLLDKDGQFQNM